MVRTVFFSEITKCYFMRMVKGDIMPDYDERFAYVKSAPAATLRNKSIGRPYRWQRFSMTSAIL